MGSTDGPMSASMDQIGWFIRFGEHADKLAFIPLNRGYTEALNRAAALHGEIEDAFERRRERRSQAPAPAPAEGEE